MVSFARLFSDIISWDQALPANVTSADAATSARPVLGFLIDGEYPYLGESGGFFNASVPCDASDVNIIDNLFTGPGFVNVSIVGSSGKRIIGWYEDTSVYSDEFTLVGGTTIVGC
ncbi:hypothetical protein RQP46_008151 [Phenoliferia psychrophenolica]